MQPAVVVRICELFEHVPKCFGGLTAVCDLRSEKTVMVKTPMEARVLTTQAFREVIRTEKAPANRVKLHLMSRP
jgi:hypothetical protein